jgi:hypothetical protein
VGNEALKICESYFFFHRLELWWTGDPLFETGLFLVCLRGFSFVPELRS